MTRRRITVGTRGSALALTQTASVVDMLRSLHPERVQYTYWDYFRNAFASNFGWRIDHIMATAPLAERCRVADVDLEPRRAASASDHTVAWAEFD